VGKKEVNECLEEFEKAKEISQSVIQKEDLIKEVSQPQKLELKQYFLKTMVKSLLFSIAP